MRMGGSKGPFWKKVYRARKGMLLCEFRHPIHSPTLFNEVRVVCAKLPILVSFGIQK